MEKNKPRINSVVFFALCCFVFRKISHSSKGGRMSHDTEAYAGYWCLCPFFSHLFLQSLWNLKCCHCILKDVEAWVKEWITLGCLKTTVDAGSKFIGIIPP